MKKSKITRGVGACILTNNCKRMISDVPSQLPNGIETDGRPIAGIDWSRAEVILNVKGQPIAKFSTLAEAAPSYKGYIWVLESTADSFELQNRQIDLDAIKANDIRAYTFNSKYTSKYRILWDDVPKSDEADSEVIRRIFAETNLCCSPFKQIVREDALRDSIQKALIEDRQFNGQKSLDIAMKYLPSFQETPPDLLPLLYPSAILKRKSHPLPPEPKKQIGRFLIAALKVREAGLGYRTFRKQIGNYGQGYGCMLRSEFYHWFVRVMTNARVKDAGLQKEAKDSHIDPKTKEVKKIRVWSQEESELKKRSMKDADKAIKYLWRLTA